MSDWRRLAVLAAVAMTVLEVVSAPTIEAPAVAIVFAALFLVGAWWARRGSRGALVLLAALSVIELVFLPTYSRDEWFDWAIQVAVAVASAACLLGCVAASRELRGAAAEPR